MAAGAERRTPECGANRRGTGRSERGTCGSRDAAAARTNFEHVIARCAGRSGVRGGDPEPAGC